MKMEEIEKIPEQLKAERTRLLELAEEAESAQRMMTQEEQRLAWDVAMEKDLNGVAVFKNELQRSVELTRRLEEKESYVMQRKTVLNRTADMERKKIDVQFLQDNLRLAEIMSRLGE